MKYYAVTNDPNELMHYGRLGMKWGQHIFAKPKSAGYKRAVSKLSKSMRNGIARKHVSWKKNPSPAVLRAKAKAKAAKKEAKAFRKEERFMKKSLQKAREGKLRYGKLSDEQVRKVTERLALEQRARQLGSTEKSRFRVRMKDAIQEGMLQGATRGGAAYIEERMRAKGKLAAKRKYGLATAKQEGREAGIKQAQTKIESQKYQDKVKKKEERKKKNRATAKKAAKTAAKGTGKAVKKIGSSTVKAGKYAAKVVRYNVKRNRARQGVNRPYTRAKSTPYAYNMSPTDYSIR